MYFFKFVITLKDRIFVISLLSFIVGIGAGNFFIIDIFVLFCLSLVIVGFGIFFWHRRSWRIVLLLLLFSILGFWRFQVSVVDFSDQSKIHYYNGQQIKFTGTVVKIDQRMSNQKITVESDSTAGHNISGKVLVTLALYPAYRYGDQLELICELQTPEPFDEFAYDKYLARYNIYSVCYYPADVSMLDIDVANILSVVYSVKDKLSDALNLSIHEPQVSILQAMILGNRRGIPSDILDQFSNVGISHIVAISGMHIAIIIMIMMSIFISLGIIRQYAFWLATGGIVFYVILIGAPASAVRAAIMGILVLYAQKIGRLNSSFNALVLAAALMLMVNPKLFLSDVGFQLSFMAVLGIIYISPILRAWIERHKLNKFRLLSEIIIITISAQIMTLPLIIFYFNKLSLVAILANVMILPIIPLVMVGGLVVAGFGLVSLLISRFLGFFVWLAVSYMLVVVNYFDQIPFGSIEIKSFNLFLVVFLYVLIGLGVYKFYIQD